MAGAGDVYPMWKFYPSAIEPPAWVPPVVAAFAADRPQIDFRLNVGVTSDAALAALRPELIRQGFEIEEGKKKAGRIRRPVLFGEVGRPVVAYEVDGFHPVHEIVLEVEAGRRHELALFDLGQPVLSRAALMAVADQLRPERRDGDRP